MEREYYGKLMRYLIDNHNKNRLVNRQEIRDMFLINNSETNNLINQTQSFMSQFGLEIIGFSELETTEISRAQKFFIRRTESSETNENTDSLKRQRMTVSEDERCLFTIFSLIQIEKNMLEEQKLLRIKTLHNNLEEFIKENKNLGYFMQKRENDISYLIYGWRFYAEYGEDFDIIEYYKNR